jgi:outer membrane protein insertion porin family
MRSLRIRILAWMTAALAVASAGCALPTGGSPLARFRPAAISPGAPGQIGGQLASGMAPPVIRGQEGYGDANGAGAYQGYAGGYAPAQPSNTYTPGSDSHLRYPMTPSQAPAGAAQPMQPAPQQSPYYQPTWQGAQYQPAPEGSAFTAPPPNAELPYVGAPGSEFLPSDFGAPGRYVDVIVPAQEARTGRFMLGAAVNSDAGVTGQITIDERNFDITRIPTSWDDIINGTAFRGAGQGFRFEAAPGSQVQRYLISFTEPYLLDTNISFNVSAFFFDRRFFDWDEQRYGGRIAFGYRLSPDLSVTAAVRAENVDITDPRVRGVPQLEEVLGNSDLFSGRVSLAHDTRDIPFAPTEGHFLVRERPDGSGRHTIGFMFRTGFSGAQTPLYENYFAGGFSTIRGFRFRGASPRVGSVTVGGEFRMLGSAEYTFPITADDMIKGVAFVDFGTVEEEIELNADDYRVAPGVGLRLNIPALGPAPLALDFAFPVADEDGDQRQIFSFFLGAMR